MTADSASVGSLLLRRKEAGISAFMPFITAGYPSLGSMRDILRMLRDSGADCLELGVPFSDPVADGATIQHASQAALERGATLDACLKVAEAGARMGHRIALMSYANPLMRKGLAASAKMMAESGISAAIIPDLPVEESPPWRAAFLKQKLDLVMFAAPTTPLSRVREIDRMGRGFIYYVSLTGVTGERTSLPLGLTRRLAAVTRIAKLPVCVGFGISTPAQGRMISRLAAGVIVGSALVRRLAQWESGGKRRRNEVAEWVSAMARSVNWELKSK